MIKKISKVNFHLDTKIYIKLKVISAKEGETVSTILRTIIAEFLEKKPKKIIIK